MAETVAALTSDQLKHEVAKLLGMEIYLWMNEDERLARRWPASDDARRDYIRQHREAA